MVATLGLGRYHCCFAVHKYAHCADLEGRGSSVQLGVVLYLQLGVTCEFLDP